MRIPVVALIGASAAFLTLTSCVHAPSGSTENSAAATAERFVAPVHRTVLDNGLTVLTREQKGSGIVAIDTWVKAGYFHEPDEVAGMAHLFEHMFFKGSQAYPGPEAIARAVSGAGGILNAGTIYDSTNYFVVLPKDSFAKAIEIQADAIAHPLFDSRELKKEAEVVIEEGNRKLDNPPAVAYERMLAVSFTQHRMKRWRIGSNEVLRNINRDHLLAFFETLYRPENIVVTVAGDVSPDEALAVVRRTFGAIPRGELRKTRGPTEPAQTAFRFGRSEADIKEGYSVFGWHTVPENDRDEVTLDVLARILGGGRSSRLYRAAVGASGASAIHADHETFEDVGVFAVTTSMPEARRAEVDARVMTEIRRLQQFGPTAYELALAKNGAEAGFLGAVETAREQAQVLSRFEARGSYRDLVRRMARVDALTADEVRDAARRYLTLDGLTLYHYQPRGARAIDAAAALQSLRASEMVAVTAPEALPLPDLRNDVAAASRDAPLQTFKLTNGASLVVQQRTGAPTVSTGIFFRGGRTSETAANAGITHLMQAAMRRGTTTRDGEAIDREIEFTGSRIGLVTQDDGFAFVFTTMTRFYEPALRVVADVLAHPAFDAREVTREKGLQAAAIRRSLDSSTERPMQLFRTAMFGSHPYGLPEQGTEATLASLDAQALRTWWKNSVAADRALVVVVGDVDADGVRRAVEQALAQLPATAGPLAAPPVPAPPTAPTQLVEERDRRQTAMVLGFPAASPASADWPALRLLQTVTSGLSGTFFAELRGRQSLAYTVFAGPIAFAGQGAFRGYLAGEAPKEATARAALLAEMRKLQDRGFTDADVARAKALYSGSTRIALESSDNRAADYGRAYVLGLPIDHTERMLQTIPTLSAADLRDAARRYLSGDNYVYAAVRGKAGTN